MLLNGREIINRESFGKPFLIGSSYRDDTFAREALRGEIESDAVSDLFFSRVNIDALQDGIRYRVHVQSGARRLVIDRQSDIDLLLVMKGIYLEHARHVRDGGCVRHVRRLNEKVLDYAVPRVLAEVDMYLKYRHDVSTIAVPMDRPANMSLKGDRQLERRRF